MSLRVIDLEADERLWILDTNKAGAKEVLRDPAKWMKANVKCDGPRSGNFVTLGSSNPVGMDRLILMNICGTSPIFIDGFKGDLIRMFEELRSEMGQPGIPWLDPLCGDLLNFQPHFDPRDGRFTRRNRPQSLTWDNLDQSIIDILNPHTTRIDFFFFEQEQKVFIHFELGKDTDFNLDFMQMLTDEPDSFLAWLKGQRTPKLGRKVFRVNADGSLTEFKLSDFNLRRRTDSLGNPLDISTFHETAGPLNCIDPCIPTACDSSFGTILSGDLASGDAEVEIQISMDKAYCRDRNTGAICP